LKTDNSIIQSTSIKISVIIFALLLLLYFFIAKIYWDKEVSKREFELLSAASASEKLIQANYKDVISFKANPQLTKKEKVDGIRNLFHNLFNSISNKNYDMEVGYYDLELNSVINIVPESSDLLLNKVDPLKISLLLEKSGIPEIITDKEVSDWDGRGVIAIAVPIRDESKIVGFTWSIIQASNIFFSSWMQFREVLVLSLILWLVVLLIINKSITKIEKSLDTFTKTVVENNMQENSEINKLPELQPVFERIKLHLDNLRDLNIKLESSNEKLITIMQGITDGFFSLDRNWEFTFINEETMKILNVRDKDLLGRNIWMLLGDSIEPVSRENLNYSMSENLQMHWEAQNPEGDKYFEYSTYPYDQGLTVFVRDRTEDKKRDQEYSRLERLNLIGQMAAGISHEIRNPLTTVRGFLQLLENRSESPKNKEYMELMITEIDRANEIITDFLSLSKVRSDSIKNENINDIIMKIHPMLEADAMNSDKNVILNLSDVPKLGLNESEIRQLILNLVRNGLEETPDGGHVSISTYMQEGNVVIAIEDQGKGISPEVQEKLGTPFVTTKENGTGLGLAISIGIVRRHNARFEFQTGKDGTTFFIVFNVEK